MIVGFQGEAGAFSDEAACALFGEVETRGFHTFDALVAAVEANEVNYGVLPCENTIHGSIARAYDLLYQHEALSIVDETTHRIEQTLIGTSDATLETVASVASHPVALEQCRGFFQRYPHVQALVAEDTAGAVRATIERGDAAHAAIGPALAAQRYGGRVLARDVQDHAENHTRFFVIAGSAQARRGLGRATLSFVLPHTAGSLYRALGIVARWGVNLRSLVARPLRGRPFEYIFHADLDVGSRAAAHELAMAISSDARVLGWY